MRRIPLTGQRGAGHFALVDDDDYDLVAAHRWYIMVTPRPGQRNGPYAQASVWRDGKGTTVLMHCLIMGATGIDHADRNGLNNQRANLRLATKSQNNANAVKYARNNLGGIPSSRFKGVCWQKRKPPRHGHWIAKISVNRKQRFLGSFASEEAAARAYDAAAVAAWGEYARLNFPPGH